MPVGRVRADAQQIARTLQPVLQGDRPEVVVTQCLQEGRTDRVSLGNRGEDVLEHLSGVVHRGLPAPATDSV
jgi:hypothetical protein